jgi:hypothetical protein
VLSISMGLVTCQILKKTIDHAISDDIQKSVYPTITRILKLFNKTLVHYEMFLVKRAKKGALADSELT